MSALSDALAARDKAIDCKFLDTTTLSQEEQEAWEGLADIVQDAAPDALDWIAKALPWMKDYRKSITFKKCDDPECQVCANNNKRRIELTALIAQAEGQKEGEE